MTPHPQAQTTGYVAPSRYPSTADSDWPMLALVVLAVAVGLWWCRWHGRRMRPAKWWNGSPWG